MKITLEGESFTVQLERIIGSRIAELNDKVTPVIAEDIAQRMKDNTLAGKAFGNDRYDNEYTPKYRVYRKRQGLPEAPVTMRANKRRIENTRIEVTSGEGSTIRFEDPDMGKVFKYHHDGIQYSKAGLRMRSIFPKGVESVPADIMDKINRMIAEVLIGRK
jgi:hypothetical protein